MGEFRRQPSKVWWSTYEDEDFSKFSGLLGWGKGVDLSENFSETCQKDSETITSKTTASTNEKGETAIEKSAGSFTENDSSTLQKEEEGKVQGKDNLRKSLESDRGSSSSPSQGSHRSQDSGFSDSEIQNNALCLSPECSPELSPRLNCITCKSREDSRTEQSDLSQKEKSYNETVANYRKLKTSVKTTPYKVVEFVPETYSGKGNKFLETAFDGFEETVKTECDNRIKEESETNVNIVPIATSPNQTSRSSLRSHISRTKSDMRDKINQIQNRLEHSFKLPKKINLSQNLKISNIFHAVKPLEETQISRTSKLKQNTSETFKSFKSLSCESIQCKRENGGKVSSASLDNEGFKVPKLPSENSLSSKGSNNFLDLTDIGGPPISSSTPKSSKFQGYESSSLPRATRVTEKKLRTKTTFATIRKLKGLSDKKLMGSPNFLQSLNRSVDGENAPEKSEIRIDFEASAKHWLSELEMMYEAEIMTTLQSKSLAADLTRQVTDMADSTSYTVKKLHQKTKTISSEFSKLCKLNKNKVDKHIGPLAQSLVGHVTEFIKEYVQKPSTTNPSCRGNEETNQRASSCQKGDEGKETSHEMITAFRKPEPETVEMKVYRPKKTKEEQVLEICEVLRKLSMQSPYDHEKIDVELSNLGQKFREVVDTLLEKRILALVRVVEEPRTELALRTALSALTALGLEANYLGKLVSKCGGIRALLAVCLEARAAAVRVSALRALATVSCDSDTIRQFEQAGGVEIIADILADEQRSEAELSEASAVIAQITAPWVQDNHSVDGLSQFLNSLVTSLTRIVSKYNSSETLLLSSAALANLTFMEPRTVWPLLKNNTAITLLSAVKRQGSKVSVFIQEQAATVIANMSSVPECRKHLAEQRAVVALLCFLEIHHSPLQSAPEVSAAERVLQKSAIALSRLCSDSTVAKQVVELQGVNRLVRLCKEEKERNHSDGVLVACLAALRKIVANYGMEALDELNATELVEPKLLDSFLLYSSKQESYV